MNPFKKLLCKHNYIPVSTYKTDVVDGLGYELKDVHILYCPKCKKTIEVYQHEYEKIIGIQEIDKKFQENELD